MITAADINALFKQRKGVTFASFDFDCPVKLAAANKHRNIRKRGTSRAQIFATIRDYKGVYENAVKRSLEKRGDSEGAERFEKQSNWFEHREGNVFSVVHHRSKGTAYLYAILNDGGNSEYYDADTGDILSKQDVAALMTPSGAKELFRDKRENYNATHDVTHSVICRTFSLENITAIRAEGWEVTA
jgi:hypothetical protein